MQGVAECLECVGQPHGGLGMRLLVIDYIQAVSLYQIWDDVHVSYM